MTSPPLDQTLPQGPDVRRSAAPSLLRFGPYRVDALLGSGGMGVVYRAFDEVLGRDVALKVLGRGDAPELRQRLLREAKALAALRHRNVCTVYTAGEEDAEVYLAMELLPGPTLKALLAGGRPPLPAALRLATDVAAGLAHAHAAGLVHRDLKPGNVMLGIDGEAKLVDFGLARALHRDDTGPADLPTTTGATTVSRFAGTPLYMAPEQVAGDAVTPRTDVWAFGLLVHELVTGAHPFADRGGALLDDIRAGRSTLALPAPGIPGELTELVLDCLATDPAARPADGTALVARLATVRTGGRRRGWRVSAAVTLTAVLGAVAWSRRTAPPPSPPRLAPPRIAWDRAAILFEGGGNDVLQPLSDDTFVLRRGNQVVVRDTRGTERPLPDLPPPWQLQNWLPPTGVWGAYAPGSGKNQAVWSRWRLDAAATTWTRDARPLLADLQPGVYSVHDAPDRIHLATSSRSQLAVVDTRSGAVTASVDLAPSDRLGDLAWARDGAGLAFVRTSARAKLAWTVEWLAVDGGPPRVLYGPAGTGTAALARHGDWFLVLRHDEARTTLVALTATAEQPPVELHHWEDESRERIWTSPHHLWLQSVASTFTLRLLRPGEGPRDQPIASAAGALTPRLIGVRGRQVVLAQRARGLTWDGATAPRPWPHEAEPLAIAGDGVLARRGGTLVRIDSDGVRELGPLAEDALVRCAPDGSWCAQLKAAPRVTVRELDPNTGALSDPLHGYVPDLNAAWVALAPRHQTIAISSGTEIVVENLTDRSSRRYPSGMQPQWLSYTRDGTALLVSGLGGDTGYAVHRIDLASGTITPLATSADTWFSTPVELADGTVAVSTRTFRAQFWRVPFLP